MGTAVMVVYAGALAPLGPGTPLVSAEPGPPLSEAQESAARLVAFTAIYEATYQPRLGRLLVMHVVVNRQVLSGQYYEALLFQRGQFVAWTQGRKHSWLLAEALEDPIYFEELAIRRLTAHPDIPEYRTKALEYYYSTLEMARRVVMGEPEPEGWEGIRYFDNPDLWPEGFIPGFANPDKAAGCVASHCFWR